MLEIHRDILGPVLFDMIPVGEFLNFVATAPFPLGPQCRKQARRLQAEVLQGIAAIRDYGLAIPPFRLALRPTISLDPLLLHKPMRRFQRLWQIEGQPICIGDVIEGWGFDLCITLREGKWPFCRDQFALSKSTDFLCNECRGLDFACWERVSSAALPWHVAQLYPRMPRRDGLTMDYAIIHFEYKTIGVAMCFFCPSPGGRDSTRILSRTGGGSNDASQT